MKTSARFWIIQSLLFAGLVQAQSSPPPAAPASGQNPPASNVVTPGTGPAANKPDEDQFTQRIFSNEVNLIFTYGQTRTVHQGPEAKRIQNS